MPVFKDTAEREWQIKIDAPKIREARQACGVDLGSLDPAIFNKLEADPALLVDVLWSLCRGQHEGINDRQFGESLVGDPVEAATKALFDAYCDFFPSRKRLLLRSLAEKQAALTDQGMAEVLQQINDPALSARMLAGLKKKMQTDIENLLTSLNGATKSPENAESGPKD